MKIVYNDVDITDRVDVQHAVINDSAGDRADRVSILFSDINKYWRQWNPIKGDKIILEHDSFNTGLMNVSETFAFKGTFKINALSVPLNSKTVRSNSWENISFLKLAKDLCNSIGLEVQFYNIEDWTYDRVDQIEETNLDFLRKRCMLEGYRLKINDSKAVIYNEKFFEENTPTFIFGEEDFIGEYSFSNISNNLFASCEIKYDLNSSKSYEFVAPNDVKGPKLITKIRTSNFSEAERFAKNILRNVNKNETQGLIRIRLNSQIASGSVILIENMGSFSGKYFIENTCHSLLKNITKLSIRKVLEGY